MNNMITLAIEAQPELLQEYGRAFACINGVEELLSQVMRLKDKTKSKEDLEIPLGAKLVLIQDGWLDENLMDKLRNLNENRKKLAHGVIGEIVENPLNPHMNKGRFALMHKTEAKYFDKGFLQKISEDAKEIISELHQALPIPKTKSS